MHLYSEITITLTDHIFNRHSEKFIKIIFVKLKERSFKLETNKSKLYYLS